MLNCGILPLFAPEQEKEANVALKFVEVFYFCKFISEF